jgi:hypothetical protein
MLLADGLCLAFSSALCSSCWDTEMVSEVSPRSRSCSRSKAVSFLGIFVLRSSLPILSSRYHWRACWLFARRVRDPCKFCTNTHITRGRYCVSSGMPECKSREGQLSRVCAKWGSHIIALEAQRLPKFRPPPDDEALRQRLWVSLACSKVD